MWRKPMARERFRAFLAALAVVAVDQLTKAWALAALSDCPVPILVDVVRLVLRFNTGAAFSVAWGGPSVLLVVNLAASAFLCWYILRVKTLRILPMLGLILGGALGNTIDRVFQGPVTDFIDIGIGTLRWPVFNVADIALVAGGLLMLLKAGGKGSEGDDRA